MAESLASVQAACFPTLNPELLMRAEHYRSHVQVFPEGQHAVIERATGRVAACSTDFRTKVDFSHYQHRYIDAVADNWLTNHDPEGDWLYGADIGVHPDFRGQGLGRLLHDHAAGVFKARGKQAMRLSVSAQNATAIAFYRKIGWECVGTREHRETMQIMEFALA